ncbi:hypothetical protein [Paenibacillus humicola]|uniref:YphA family membrane protein n=1 Tax=Paenibacillus humicola TaxID=3110540 RepID=UPI00237C4698|nr:hypothetical protein [Paenibacillus humicola]
MNDGYTALWLGLIGGILYITGWRERNDAAPPAPVLLLLLAAAVWLHAYEWPIGSGIRISGSAALLLVCLMAYVLTRGNGGETALLAACSGLAGLLWVWIRCMYAADPVFVLIRPEWDGPLLAGAAAGLLSDKARLHYAIAAAAAAAAPLSGLLQPGLSQPAAEIGGPAWWDGLALAALAARLTGCARLLLRQASERVNGSRLKQRGGNS